MATSEESGVRRLWQEQPLEATVIPMDEIRAEAARFEAKTRREYRVGAALFLVIVALEAWQIWRTPELVERVGDALTVAAFVYVAFQFRRDGGVSAMPPGLSYASCVDCHRAQLARQRDLAAASWRYLLPFVPGVGLSLLGRSIQERTPGQVLALIGAGVTLFLGVAAVNAWTARKLQKEIDLLE